MSRVKTLPPRSQLIPADPKQCQAEITPAHGPFILGPKPRPKRCINKPSVIVAETKPGTDGQRGSMSLCTTCLTIFFAQYDSRDYVTTEVK